MDINHEIFTVSETAEMLRVKEPTIRSWISNYRLPTIRMGRKIFIRKEVIKTVLKDGLEGVRSVDS